jgi:mannose/fructose/N-acetylgalactosamine-specific phosphotransferase system component IID
LLGTCEVGALSGGWVGANDDPVGSSQGPGQRTNAQTNQEKVHTMLYTIAVVLLIMWLLGLVTSYTMGGFIHILLVIAVVMVLVNLISGRRSV